MSRNVLPFTDASETSGAPLSAGAARVLIQIVLELVEDAGLGWAPFVDHWEGRAAAPLVVISNDKLAELCRISRSQIYRSLSYLQKNGHIRRDLTIVDGKPVLGWRVLTPDHPMRDPGRMDATPVAPVRPLSQERDPSRTDATPVAEVRRSPDGPPSPPAPPLPPLNPPISQNTAEARERDDRQADQQAGARPAERDARTSTSHQPTSGPALVSVRETGPAGGAESAAAQVRRRRPAPAPDASAPASSRAASAGVVVESGREDSAAANPERPPDDSGLPRAAALLAPGTLPGLELTAGPEPQPRKPARRSQAPRLAALNLGPDGKGPPEAEAILDLLHARRRVLGLAHTKNRRPTTQAELDALAKPLKAGATWDDWATVIRRAENDIRGQLIRFGKGDPSYYLPPDGIASLPPDDARRLSRVVREDTPGGRFYIVASLAGPNFSRYMQSDQLDTPPSPPKPAAPRARPASGGGRRVEYTAGQFAEEGA